MSFYTSRHKRLTLVFRALPITIIAVIANACGTPGVAGKYVSEKNSANYLELKPDGTLFVQQGSQAVTGKYEIEGKQITLKFDIGMADRGQIEGKTITDHSGDRWTKP